MSVTELALIELRSGYDELGFLELLMECQEIQDDWSREHHPHVLTNKPYNILSTFCIQKSEPPYLLITAPWDSPEAHRDWIKSKENQTVFANLSEYIAPGCNSTLLFHMTPAGRETDLRGDLFAKEKFSVCKLSVGSDKREAMQIKYQSIEDQVRETGPEKRIWAGWRIERCHDDIEDLIVFWSQAVSGDLVQELLNMSEMATEIRQFQNVVGRPPLNSEINPPI